MRNITHPLSLVSVLLLATTACNSPTSSTSQSSQDALVSGSGAWARMRALVASASDELSNGLVLKQDQPSEPKVQGQLEEPADVLASARIHVLAIQIKGSNGWLTFPIDAFDLSLLDLSTQFASVVARASLPSGSYDQVRLIVEDEGEAVLHDGRHLPLLVPSGSNTGIKVHLSPALNIASGELVNVTAEFDIQRQFVLTGSGVVHFKPVVRARISIVAPPGGGTSGGSTGGSDGGSTGESTGGTDGGTDGGSTGESTGGTDGGTTGESSGGTDGGVTGGTDGGSTGGETGGTDGGSTGGGEEEFPPVIGT